MRGVLFWVPTVFFVPLMLPHLQLVLGCTEPANRFYPSVSCGSGEHIALSALSVLLFAMIGFAAVATTALFFNMQVPASYQVRDNPVNARSTNRPEMVLLLGKTLALVLLVASTGTSWRYPTSLITLGAGFSALVSNYKLMPWWRDCPQAMYLFQALLVCWVGLIGCVMTATGDAEGSGMLFFIFVPVLAVAAVMLQRRRLVEVGLLQERDLTEPYLVDVKIRYTIHAYVRYMLSLGDIYVEFGDDQMAKRIEVVDKVTKLIEYGAHRFPDSCTLRVSAAFFYTTVLYNRLVAYRDIHAAHRLSPDVGQRFRLRDLVAVLAEATRRERSPEVAAFLAFKHHRALVDSAATEATRHLVGFWTELLQPRPDIDELSSVGEAAQLALARTLGHVDVLLQLNPNSVPVLRLSAMIYLELTGEVQRAVANFERADRLENEKKRTSLEYDSSNFLQRLDNANLDIFDEENGVITIMASPEDMGTVESVNPALLRMFGYQRDTDLVGKNVNKLLPEPIAGEHDALIGDFLLSRKTRVVNATRMVFGVHHLGYLLGLSMHVRWSDESLGKLIAVMHPITNSYEVCVIAAADGSVLYGTANLSSVFGFPKRDINAQVVKLAQMLPALASHDTDDAEAAERDLFAATGLSCESAHALTQQAFRVQAYAVIIPIRDTQFTFVRCQVTQTQSEPGLDDDLVELDAPALAGDHSDAQAAGFSIYPPQPQDDDTLAHPLLRDRERADSDDEACARDSALAAPLLPLVLVAPTTAAYPGLSSHRSLLSPRDQTPREGVPSSMSWSQGRPPLPHSARTPTSTAAIPASAASTGRWGTADQSEGSPAASPHLLPPTRLSLSASEAPAASPHPPRLSAPMLDIPESAAAEQMSTSHTDARPQTESSTSSSPRQAAEDTNPACVQRADPLHASQRTAGNLISVASTTSLGRSKRATQGHARLLAAIANDSKRTLAKLRLMNITSVIMICIVLGLNVALFVTSRSYISNSAELSNTVALSIERQTALMDMITNLRIYKQLAVSVGLQTLVNVFYMSGIHANNVYPIVFSAYRSRVSGALVEFWSDSLEVDSSPISDAALATLRYDSAAVPMEFLTYGGLMETSYGLREAASIVSSAVRWAISTELRVDISVSAFYFTVLVAGISSLRTATNTNSSLLVDYQERMHDELVTIAIVILVCSVVSVLIVLFFFIWPLVVQIEEGKTRVLLIFQSVPYSTRKALRRKAYGVYKITRAEGDDGVNRAMQEEDDAEQDKQSGAASQAGSEWTSYTKYSDAASAAMLRRYNKPASASGAAQPGSSMTRRSGMAHEAITVARTTELSPRGPALTQASLSTAGGSETELVELHAHGAAPPQPSSARLSPNQAAMEPLSPREKPLLVPAALRATSSASATLAAVELPADGYEDEEDKGGLSKDDQLRIRLEGEQSLLARRATAILLGKYGFFLLVIGVYFGLCIWQTVVQLDGVENATRLMAVASLRMPSMQYAFFQARQFLFYTYSDVTDATTDATTRDGDYRESALTNLDEFRATTRAALFGDSAFRLSVPTISDEQFELLYGDACGIDTDRFTARVPVSPDYVLSMCREVESGILEHGLYGALDFIDAQISTMLDPVNEAALNNYIYKLPPNAPHTAATVAALLDVLQRTSILVNEFVLFMFKYSSALYLEQTLRWHDDFRTILAIFLGTFSALLALCYVVLFYPTSVALYKASNATKSVLLLLPPDVIRLAQVQHYIDENRD